MRRQPNSERWTALCGAGHDAGPMTSAPNPLLDRMDLLIDGWRQADDSRGIFLECYAAMTRNMIHAVAEGEFEDGPWVTVLLHRFADYYFAALDRHEAGAPETPAVWTLTFDAATRPRTHVLQHLVLGVNAHINYDLVFVLDELLREEWAELPRELRASRQRDHRHVNEVICRTIDLVQDGILERHSPRMNVIDVGFGRLDEWLLGRLIRNWREEVWQNATALLECEETEALTLRGGVDAAAVRRGQSILLEHGVLGLRNLL